MPISIANIKFRKAKREIDLPSGGGEKGDVLVISGQRHNLFPRVSKAMRDEGWRTLRKEFGCNENADNEVVSELLFYLEGQSNGEDWFTFAQGTQTDTIAETSSLFFMGCGKLNADLAGGEDTIELLMEENGIPFMPGGLTYIHDRIHTEQTLQDGTIPGYARVRVGDSCQNASGTWEKIASTEDIQYPVGIYLGNSTVFTAQTGNYNESFLRILDTKIEAEVICNVPDGNTSNNPTLSDLAGISRKLMIHAQFPATITAMCSGQVRTVSVNEDGTCSGYCSSGQINRSTGEWITPISWSSSPDSLTSISVTYWDQPYLYSGASNVVTVYLAEQVPVAYSANNTYASGVVEVFDVVASISDWQKSVTGDGDYNVVDCPVKPNNYGTEEDTVLLSYTSPTAFICSGVSEGNMGTGSVSENFSPINPKTGTAYCTIYAAGWTGTHAPGDNYSFRLHPGAQGVWLKQKGSAGCEYEPDNLVLLGHMVS